MQRRKQAPAGPSAATQEAWGAADDAAKQRDVSSFPAPPDFCQHDALHFLAMLTPM